MIVALALTAALAAVPPAAGAGEAGGPPPPGCAHADEQPAGPETLAAARDAILCLLNDDRRAHGRRTLRANPRLRRAAQAYASALDPNGPLVHVGHDDSTPRSRIRAARYAKRFLYAEALGRSTGRAATPSARVEGWLASASTRAILRSARFRDIGIGLTVAGDKATFVIVVAAKEPTRRHTPSTRTASARAKRSSGSSSASPKSSRN